MLFFSKRKNSIFFDFNWDAFRWDGLTRTSQASVLLPVRFHRKIKNLPIQLERQAYD